jgi:hypothetical protein
MSVILQPYQQLPFYTSLDFQTRYKEGGDICTYSNMIDEDTFIPFAIVSADSTVGAINLFNCDNEYIQTLSITLNSYYDDFTGLWFHYYNGDDFGLSCGTYYITIQIGITIWYSELFTIHDIVNSSQYPELIKDDFHLPLRIYDSLTKQLNNKQTLLYNEVQPLNPISTITPFMFYTEDDINDMQILLIDACTMDEYDLTEDLELEYIKENQGSETPEIILTTSQQLRNETYEFLSQNYIYQEIKINDTGTLNDITFEYYYNGVSQTIEIDLIKGVNPLASPVNIYTETDSVAGSKEITIDYSSYSISVVAGEIYLLKISTNATCSGGLTVNSVRVYPDGKFYEVNTIAPFKDLIYYDLYTRNIIGDTKRPVFQKVSGSECFGNSFAPASPSAYSFYYLAAEPQMINIKLKDFGFTINVIDWMTPAIATITIEHNAVKIYEFTQTYTEDTVVNMPEVNYYINMATNDTIKVYFTLSAYNPAGQDINVNSKVYVNVYYYGSIVGGLWSGTTGFIPTGANAQNKSLWFQVNVLKAVETGGTGSTIIYNPGRPLPSPLPCGIYYLKLESPLNTWYSEWFRVINVGSLDLTVFALGTESGELIITEDSELIEI